MPESSAAQAPVLFEEQPARGGQRIAIATLNAPKTLNALSLAMIRALQTKLAPRLSGEV